MTLQDLIDADRRFLDLLIEDRLLLIKRIKCNTDLAEHYASLGLQARAEDIKADTAMYIDKVKRTEEYIMCIHRVVALLEETAQKVVQK